MKGAAFLAQDQNQSPKPPLPPFFPSISAGIRRQRSFIMSSSRPAPLPPRVPFQKKHNPHQSPPQTESYWPQHKKSSSQSLILEEKPAWLDDLLNDPEMTPSGLSLRRSSSDSVTLLNDLMDSLPPLDDEENSVDSEPGSGLELESACMYGPNSPRKKGHLVHSGNALVSALSESLSQDPVHHADDNKSSFPGITRSNSRIDGYESNLARRHAGQRSRVRKLQYIAELERTVGNLQVLISELAAGVHSQLQHHVALSVENSGLQQQLTALHQEKMILEGEHRVLKKEAERLSFNLAKPPTNKFRTRFGPGPATPTGSKVPWQMLDMSKLNLS